MRANKHHWVPPRPRRTWARRAMQKLLNWLIWSLDRTWQKVLLSRAFPVKSFCLVMIFVLCFFCFPFFRWLLSLDSLPGLLLRFPSSLRRRWRTDPHMSSTILSLVLCSAALPMNYASWCSINGQVGANNWNLSNYLKVGHHLFGADILWLNHHKRFVSTSKF